MQWKHKNYLSSPPSIKHQTHVSSSIKVIAIAQHFSIWILKIVPLTRRSTCLHHRVEREFIWKNLFTWLIVAIYLIVIRQDILKKISCFFKHPMLYIWLQHDVEGDYIWRTKTIHLIENVCRIFNASRVQASLNKTSVRHDQRLLRNLRYLVNLWKEFCLKLTFFSNIGLSRSYFIVPWKNMD